MAKYLPTANVLNANATTCESRKARLQSSFAVSRLLFLLLDDLRLELPSLFRHRSSNKITHTDRAAEDRNGEKLRHEQRGSTSNE